MFVCHVVVSSIQVVLVLFFVISSVPLSLIQGDPSSFSSPYPISPLTHMNQTSSLYPWPVQALSTRFLPFPSPLSIADPGSLHSSSPIPLSFHYEAKLIAPPCRLCRLVAGISSPVMAPKLFLALPYSHNSFPAPPNSKDCRFSAY